jgi:hypothetical protein
MDDGNGVGMFASVSDCKVADGRNISRRNGSANLDLNGANFKYI